jgi:hypothetical protein
MLHYVVYTVRVIELLTRQVPTAMHKFNICDTKSLEVHFHPDMFWWRIYHHQQGQTFHTESWGAASEIKVLLFMYTSPEYIL